MKKRFCYVLAGALILIALAAFIAPLPATAQSSDRLNQYLTQIYGAAPRAEALDLGSILSIPAFYSTRVVAKAQPDECYYGVGDSRNLASFRSFFPNDMTAAQKSACIADGGKLKTNQAYVWGLVSTGSDVWFSTVANTLCLVLGGFYPSGTFNPMETDSYVCELNANGNSDYRFPRMYVYNATTGQVTDLTPQVFAKGQGSADYARLMSTYGLRSAGAFNNVVYFGGLGANVNIFAFNATTKQYLGSFSFPIDPNTNRPMYDNIRQWRVINGSLYTGVALRGGGGHILRWTGTVAAPFTYEVVGNVGGDPAYFTEHKTGTTSRIYVSTWGGGGGMILSMSPEVSAGHPMLTLADAGGWKAVWTLSSYEVEPAAVQSGGAIASYDGYVYWGTMTVPMMASAYFSRFYPDSKLDAVSIFAGTYRPINIFRGKNFGTASQVVEVLYGSAQLPKYDKTTDQFVLVKNGMNQNPRYGPAGFGNFFNNYTWWMEVYKGDLFVGTMDFSYLVGTLIGPENLPPQLISAAPTFNGADVWRFHTSSLPALPMSMNGVNNPTNYGIRTMIVSGQNMYFGSANPMNLLTDPNRPLGGWELIKVTKIY